MNILFINLPNNPYSEQSLLLEPIDIITMVTYMKKNGHNVDFIDMDFYRLSTDYLFNYMSEKFKTDILVMTLDYHIPLHTHYVYNTINTICTYLKNKNITTIILGKTITYNNKLFDYFNADIGIIGEAEIVLKEICEKNDLTYQNIKDIDGIIYRYDNCINTTPKRKTKINLNSLPIPDRDYLSLKEYNDVRSILSSRGCLNKCSFCPTPNFFGSWRGKSAENVIDEIDYLVSNHGAKKILFLDDNATVDKKRMLTICKKIIEKKLNISFGCLSSINTYDSGLFTIMSEAGFKWVHFGIETANANILKKHNKYFDIDYAQKVIYDVKMLGLRVRTSFIMDIPGTTPFTLEQTKKFMLDTQPDEIRAHFLVYRYGSNIYLKNDSIHTNQYLHNSSQIYSLDNYASDAFNIDIKNILYELEKLKYNIIYNTNDWNNLEKLRNKDGKIKFISFCPAKYGIDWI